VDWTIYKCMGIASFEDESTWEGSSCWDLVLLKSNGFPARFPHAWSVVCAFLGIFWSFDALFISGCTTFLFPCTKFECIESSLMSKIDGSIRVYACCIWGAWKVLSVCVSKKEDSSLENLVNLYNLELWSTSLIAMMKLSSMPITKTESDVNSTFLPF